MMGAQDPTAELQQAVILAGGRAERLRPLIEDRPKAMVEVAGRPIVEHQLRWLADNGIHEVVISLGYRADVLRSHVGDGSRIGMSVVYAIEAEPLGRGGGLRFAAAHPARPTETFVALNGDIVCRFSLREMVRLHRRLHASATIALAPYRSTWGVVELDGDLITGFTQSRELPYWINAGVYVLEADTVERLPTRGDHEDTTFPELAAEGRLAGFRIEGYWRGIDTPKDVREAAHELTQSSDAVGLP
jgi:NDP-sugar pyrophosphorylase family protein